MKNGKEAPAFHAEEKNPGRELPVLSEEELTQVSGGAVPAGSDIDPLGPDGFESKTKFS